MLSYAVNSQLDKTFGLQNENIHHPVFSQPLEVILFLYLLCRQGKWTSKKLSSRGYITGKFGVLTPSLEAPAAGLSLLNQTIPWPDLLSLQKWITCSTSQCNTNNAHNSAGKEPGFSHKVWFCNNKVRLVCYYNHQVWWTMASMYNSSIFISVNQETLTSI